jgi:hypothetical protein
MFWRKKVHPSHPAPSANQLDRLRKLINPVPSPAAQASQQDDAALVSPLTVRRTTWLTLRIDEIEREVLAQIRLQDAQSNAAAQACPQQLALLHESAAIFGD